MDRRDLSVYYSSVGILRNIPRLVPYWPYWRVRLSKQETLTPPGHVVSPLVCRGPWMSTVLLYWCKWWCISSFVFYIFLSHLFPLPCGAGSTVPREGFDSSVIMPFPGVLWLLYFLCVGPHPLSSLHIYTFVVSRTFMAGAAIQAGDADSSRAPGLTSSLQGSVNVHVLNCCCHSDGASVLLYFTLLGGKNQVILEWHTSNSFRDYNTTTSRKFAYHYGDILKIYEVPFPE